MLVSNGCDVVRTSDDGSWQLPVADGDTLFVVKPPDWEVPRTTAIPSFYRHHRPHGTPASLGLAYPGLDPTGTIKQPIDFPLRRSPEQRGFEALLLADVQPANETELGYFRQETLAAIAKSQAAFVINHGDVMGDVLSLFPRYRDAISATGLPWHHCPGNHDMNLECADGQNAFETWKREIGPTHYAFQYADVTFILLNNVDYYGNGRHPAGQRGYRGLIGERQLRFVANILSHVPRHRLVAVSMHIPLRSFEDPANPADNTADRARLLELLSGRPATVSFSGHSHTNEHHYFGRADGFDGVAPHHHQVLTAACGSWWGGPKDGRDIPVSDCRDGTPKGFHVLTVDGAHYDTRFVATDARAGQQMRIVVSGAGDANSASLARAEPSGAGPELVVNVFDGGPAHRVVVEVDGSGLPPIEMTRTARTDPHFAELYARNPALFKPWVAPAASSHVWTARLPAGIAPGRHALIVRARDGSGREHVARQHIETSI